MSVTAHDSAHADGLVEQLAHATGESVFACYQCGKCTAGCPLASEMDYAPHQIIRLLQLGLPALEEEALRALSMWLCVTCETCASRCPQEVELPKIMEYLRQQALAHGVAHPKSKDILAFYESFLGSVRQNGRLHEVGLISAYKMRTLHLLQDVLLAPKLFMRGKLSILPHGVHQKDDIRRIFDRCREHGEHDHGDHGHTGHDHGHEPEHGPREPHPHGLASADKAGTP